MSAVLRVLVIDDEEGLRTGVARVFRRLVVEADDKGEGHRFETHMAATAREAREQWSQRSYDLYLVDYKLPDANGLDLVRELRALDPDVPIIVVTAFASLEVAVTATKNGAFDFLCKPFTPEELEAVVRKAVRHLVLQRRARALEEERRRTRFEFLSVLAHELKAPLGAVENYLQIIRDQVLGPYVSQYETQLDRALSRIAGMRKMISDLLDLTRIESGQKRRELRMVDVVEVARSVFDAHTGEASAREVVLDLRAPPAVPMMADRGELEMILNNLISNAIKYNRRGGRVEVTIDEEPDRVVLRVRDTGIGMSPEDTQKLFREFVRIRNEHTVGIPGSGLGLSIVRKLVDLYGGEIRVSSQPQVGTEFTIVLPATGNPATDGVPSSAPTISRCSETSTPPA